MNPITLLSLIAVTAVLFFIFSVYKMPPLEDTSTDQKTEPDNYYQRGSIDENSEGKKITSNDRKYTSGTSIEKRNEFITEYTIPAPCTEPVGIVLIAITRYG